MDAHFKKIIKELKKNLDKTKADSNSQKLAVNNAETVVEAAVKKTIALPKSELAKVKLAVANKKLELATKTLSTLTASIEDSEGIIATQEENSKTFDKMVALQKVLGRTSEKVESREEAITKLAKDIKAFNVKNYLTWVGTVKAIEKESTELKKDVKKEESTEEATRRANFTIVARAIMKLQSDKEGAKEGIKNLKKKVTEIMKAGGLPSAGALAGLMSGYGVYKVDKNQKAKDDFAKLGAASKISALINKKVSKAILDAFSVSEIIKELKMDTWQEDILISLLGRATLTGGEMVGHIKKVKDIATKLTSVDEAIKEIVGKEAFYSPNPGKLIDIRNNQYKFAKAQGKEVDFLEGLNSQADNAEQVADLEHTRIAKGTTNQARKEISKSIKEIETKQDALSSTLRGNQGLQKTKASLAAQEAKLKKMRRDHTRFLRAKPDSRKLTAKNTWEINLRKKERQLKTEELRLATLKSKAQREESAWKKQVTAAIKGTEEKVDEAKISPKVIEGHQSVISKLGKEINELDTNQDIKNDFLSSLYEIDLQVNNEDFNEAIASLNEKVTSLKKDIGPASGIFNKVRKQTSEFYAKKAENSDLFQKDYLVRYFKRSVGSQDALNNRIKRFKEYVTMQPILEEHIRKVQEVVAGKESEGEKQAIISLIKDTDPWQLKDLKLKVAQGVAKLQTPAAPKIDEAEKELAEVEKSLGEETSEVNKMAKEEADAAKRVEELGVKEETGVKPPLVAEFESKFGEFGIDTPYATAIEVIRGGIGTKFGEAVTSKTESDTLIGDMEALAQAEPLPSAQNIVARFEEKYGAPVEGITFQEFAKDKELEEVAFKSYQDAKNIIANAEGNLQAMQDRIDNLMVGVKTFEEQYGAIPESNSYDDFLAQVGISVTEEAFEEYIREKKGVSSA